MAFIETLSDTFDDNVTDTSLWTTTVTAGSIAETGGQLVIIPPPNSTEYDSYTSVSNYNFKGSQSTIACIQTLNAFAGCEQQLSILLNTANGFYMFYTGAGSLCCRIKTANVNSDTFIVWNALSMKWWRLREIVGGVYWDTSPDGSNWTTRRSSGYSFAITNLLLQLSAGTYQSVASPGTAIFDSLNILKTGTSGWLTA